MELEVSERVLIKINERVLNQDGVLIKVNERNNSDAIKDHARAHARTRAEPYPCSATTALAVRPPAMPGGWDAVAELRCASNAFGSRVTARRAGDRLGYGSQVDAPDSQLIP